MSGQTEKQALQRWCPMSRVVDRGGDVVNRSVDGQNWGTPTGCNCIGSMCMAWHWTGQREPDLSLGLVEEQANLSVRTRNVLHAENLWFLSDVAILTEQKLKRFPNFGSKSIAEVKEALANKDMKLGMPAEAVTDRLGYCGMAGKPGFDV